MKGSKQTGQLKNGYTVEDIRKLVAEKFGSGNFRLIVSGKEIREDDPAGFAETKKSIKNNTVIYVCQRMDGGSGEMLSMDIHRATILTDLEAELCRIPVQAKISQCMVCTEAKQCIRYCCGSVICRKCFANYFVYANYKISCLTCNRVSAPEDVFMTAAFIASLKQLDEMTKMARNIDFQVCTCGTFAINSTMYARQKCENCQRWLCFFCNADWDEQGRGMRNEKYSCRANCSWETKITHQLVTLALNKEMQVPNRRCCPKCFECGSYDEKCKYHTCGCGYKFCFICLNPESDCQRLYKSSYNRPCGAVAQQSYTMFPRLCH